MKDPVCGMTVTAQSAHSLQHEGKPVYFCSAGCKTKFAADPVKYSGAATPAVPATSEPEIAGAIYTCPMHPEIRQDHPGDCPKCGMALEPEMPTLDEGENPELIDFRRRFFWTLPLTVIVTVLAMAGHRLQWFAMATQSWIELVLTVPIVLWATTSASFGRWFVVGKTFSSITDGVYSAGLPPYKKSYTVDTAKFPDAISLIVNGISADRATVCRLDDGKFYASWRRVGPGYRLPNEAPKRKQE